MAEQVPDLADLEGLDAVNTKATLRTLQIERDKDGEIVPREVITPLDGHTIRVKPMTYQDNLTYQVKMDTMVTDFPTKLKRELLVNHVQIWEPEEGSDDPEAGEWVDFPPISLEELERTFDWIVIDDFVAAVVMYSRAQFRRLIEPVGANGKKGKVKTSRRSSTRKRPAAR